MAVLTPTSRVSLDCTSSVTQLHVNLERGLAMEGEAPSTRGGTKYRRSRSFSGFFGGYPGISKGPRGGLGEEKDKYGGDYDDTEVKDSLSCAPEAPGTPSIALSNQPLVYQAERSLLSIMEKMNQFMGHLTQKVSPRDTFKVPYFKTPSMKVPYSLSSTQSH
ncbi:hypothetical protein O181_053659 [Austropuccinia psidii MF-1]|uniref:Uncharacterized protein n=1 Tax=Austropuccinia psidii MF-1 TaxID=1389203 RepID=A0A9Q3E315_9BASI|nr:hypothetical protein [Austropuccinia psidii MF-1]